MRNKTKTGIIETNIMKRVAKILFFALYISMVKESTARDCLQCWSEVCMTGNSLSLDNNFLDDCCNCVGENCLESAISADRSQQCCSQAQSALFMLFQLSNEAICNSTAFPFLRPEEVVPVAPPPVTLQPSLYLVPSFTFQCVGCIREIQVLAMIDGYSYSLNAEINVTMTFSIWDKYIDGENSLYSMKGRMTKTVSEDNIEVNSARTDQFIITFPLSNELCFEAHQMLAFSSASDINVILDDNIGDILSLHPNTNEVCSELSDFHTATLNVSSRIPVMAIGIDPVIVTPSITVTSGPVTESTLDKSDSGATHSPSSHTSSDQQSSKMIIPQSTTVTPTQGGLEDTVYISIVIGLLLLILILTIAIVSIVVLCRWRRRREINRKSTYLTNNPAYAEVLRSQSDAREIGLEDSLYDVVKDREEPMQDLTDNVAYDTVTTPPEMNDNAAYGVTLNLKS